MLFCLELFITGHNQARMNLENTGLLYNRRDCLLRNYLGKRTTISREPERPVAAKRGGGPGAPAGAGLCCAPRAPRRLEGCEEPGVKASRQ